MTVDGVLRKDGSTSRSWEADLMQAAYLLELLCRYRLEAEMSRAKLYVNIHKLIVAGNRARGDDLRRLIPATEAGWLPSTSSAKHFGIELSRCVPRFCGPPNQARATSAKMPLAAGGPGLGVAGESTAPPCRPPR
jgi:hypothetical protein